MWKLHLLTWMPVHPQKELTSYRDSINRQVWYWHTSRTRCASGKHTTGTIQLQDRTHPRQDQSSERRPSERGGGEERERDRDTSSGVPSAPRLHASIDLLLDPFRSSGQLGRIRINSPTPPFLHWFLLFFPFHCISLFYVSFSYPGTITTPAHWSYLRRNSLPETGQPA